MTHYYKATIAILLDVESEAEACDAIAETMRPLTQRFEPGSCIVDWAHTDDTVPDDGAGFEDAEEDAEVIENLGDCPVCDGHLTLDGDGLTHCPSCGLDYADEGETA